MTSAAPVVTRPALDGLSPVDRSALAALWTGAVRGGAADVPAFAEAAVLLAALDAPLDLVGRAAACSADQARSVTSALLLASAYAGAPVALPPARGLLGRPPGGVRRERPALHRLAVRAYRDGLLLGGHAAQVTCWASATATDPAARATLAVVAGSEARACALWDDVLGWVLDRRPRLVARLRDVEAPPTSPLAAVVASSPGDPAVLAAHGWPRAAQVERLWAAHVPAVVARLA